MKESLFHYGVALCVLVLTGFAVAHQVQTVEWETPPPAPAAGKGSASVADSSGNSVACRRYRRIVVCAGASLVQRLAVTDRVIAIDRAEATNAATKWAFLHTARVEGLTDTVAILSTHPDLVLAHASSEIERAAEERLRVAGFAVFDAGGVTSLADLEKLFGNLGDLLEARSQAKHAVADLELRARLLSLHSPAVATSVRVVGMNGNATVDGRLRTAIALAGIDSVGAARKQISLRPGALDDPLGSDLVDVATTLRLQVDAR